jgi:nicotinamidase-related amidase
LSRGPALRVQKSEAVLGAHRKEEDLNGSVPDQSRVALVLIDVINDFEFEDAEPIFTNSLAISARIAALKDRAKSAGIPVVYANDNFGRWQSDFRKLLDHCLEDNVRGKPIAELLKPREDDYFVLKPKHSAFYSTTFEVLIGYLGATTLILTGIAANNCVLFTAGDAYMRDYRIFVPSDCVASATLKDNEIALQLMKAVLKADTRPSTDIDLERLLTDQKFV